MTSIRIVDRLAHGIHKHFSTNSPLFKDHQRRGVAISNLGLTVMSCILIEYSRAVGGWGFFKLYFVPYLVRIE